MDGESVTGWLDQSGNGNDAAQPVSTSQPRLIADAINGHPAIQFDGLDDTLRIPDAPGLNPGTQSFLYVAVGQWLSPVGGWNVWSGKTAPYVGTNWRLFRTSAGTLALYWGIDGQGYPPSAAVVPSAVSYLLGWGIDASTNELIYITNGSVQRIAVTIQGTGLNASAMVLGADEQAYFTHMLLAEQVFYSPGAVGFAPTDLTALTDYFAARYGL